MVMARELEKVPAKALEVGKPAFVTVASIVEIVSIHSFLKIHIFWKIILQLFIIYTKYFNIQVSVEPSAIHVKFALMPVDSAIVAVYTDFYIWFAHPSFQFVCKEDMFVKGKNPFCFRIFFKKIF